MDIISPTYETRADNHRVYVLKGNPTPLARARFAHNHVYDSQKNIKLVTGISLRNQHNDLPPYEGPLALYATFYFPIPIKYKKTVHAGQPYKSIPDLSNLVKFIEDVCQDTNLFKNDSQITIISASKVYDNEPRSEFYFVELNKEKESNGKKI